MDLLCTRGGVISMTFIFVERSCSRRTRVNTFSAALEAEYAGIVAAGIMAR